MNTEKRYTVWVKKNSDSRWVKVSHHNSYAAALRRMKREVVTVGNLCAQVNDNQANEILGGITLSGLSFNN